MKRMRCERCGPGEAKGSAYFDAEVSATGKPIWQCRCCGGEVPRRVYMTARRRGLGDKKLMRAYLIEGSITLDEYLRAMVAVRAQHGKGNA